MLLARRPWADEVEIEFMIDTGCQVTILAASLWGHVISSVQHRL